MSAPRHSVDVRAWLERALDDLRWARHSYEGGFLPQACFGCQQATEKALKSFLLANDEPLRRTHSLPELLSLSLPFAAALAQFSDSLTVLDAYYAPTRYADVMSEIDFTPTRAEDALNRAEQVVRYLQPLIEAKLQDV